jgi:hypothetical protein
MTNEDDTVTTAPKVINFAQRRMQLLAGETQPTGAEGLPEFIAPADISKMSDEQLDQLINIIRLRRLNSTMLYERTMREKDQLTMGRARELLEKKCATVWRDIDKALTHLEKLELHINQMRALRLQCNLEW